MRGKKYGFMAAMMAVSLICAAPQLSFAADKAAGTKEGPTASKVEQGEAAGAGQVTGAQQTDVPEEMSDLQERLMASTQVIQTMMAQPEGVPPGLLKNSKAIAIFPDVTKVALGIGGRYGGGVMFLHQNNEWSGPIFISLYGASVGAQLGAEQSDLVMVFTDQKGLDDFSDGELQLGAEASIAAGPWGAKAGASTQADVLAYKQTAGVFAGIALSGAVLNTGEENNKMYYSKTKQPYTSAKDVFTGKEKLPKTEHAAQLIDALNKYVQQ